MKIKTQTKTHAAVALRAGCDGASNAAAQATVEVMCRARCFFASVGAGIALLAALTASTTAQGKNYFPWGWCTWGAIAEWDKNAPAPGCDWSGNAGAWVDNAKAKNWVTYTDTRAAEPGAIIVWKNGNMGHCGVVTSVSGGGISVKEMNWGKQVPGAEAGWTDMAGRYGTRTLRFSDKLSTASYKFAGFIMPRKTAAYTLDVVLNNQAVADMQSLRRGNGNFGAIVPNSLSVNRNWSPDYELRSSSFNYWLGRVTVYHATRKLDPKVRFTNYYEPFTKQWTGWIQVR